MTLNELTLGVERLARVGDAQGLNALRDKLADMLGVDLSKLNIKTPASSGNQAPKT